MGELFFILRMVIYTIALIILMQIKIGTTTIEEKVIDFTHNSSFSAAIQKVAEGGVRALGVGYSRTIEQLESVFAKEPMKKNIPGQRLKATVDSTKSTLREIFGAEEEPVKSEEITDQPSE